MYKPAYFLSDITSISTLVRTTLKSIEDASSEEYPLTNNPTLAALFSTFLDLNGNLSLIESFCRTSGNEWSSEIGYLRATLKSCREHISQLKRVAIDFDHDLMSFIRRELMGKSYPNTTQRLTKLVAGLTSVDDRLSAQYHIVSVLLPAVRSHAKGSQIRAGTAKKGQHEISGGSKSNHTLESLGLDSAAAGDASTMNGVAKTILASSQSYAATSAQRTSLSVQKSHGLTSNSSHSGAYTETLPTTHLTSQVDPQATKKNFEETEFDDRATTYSIGTISDELDIEYVQAFAHCLARDVARTSEIKDIAAIPFPYMSQVLKAFSWRLHEESSNSFQRGTCVTLHRQVDHIVDVLTYRENVGGSRGPTLDRSTKEPRSGHQSTSNVDSSSELDAQEEPRVAFVKSQDMLSEWLRGVSHNEAYDPSETQDHQRIVDTSVGDLSTYEAFIRESKAYRWLITKICQHERLTFPTHDAMNKIGWQLQETLRANSLPRRMSHRRPATLVDINLNVEWHPKMYIDDQNISEISPKSLDSVVCATGGWHEAQVMTISEYLRQTWPLTCEPVIELFGKMFNSPQESIISVDRGLDNPNLLVVLQSPKSCNFRLRGGLFCITDIVEQIAWLVAALHPSAENEGRIIHSPSLIYMTQSSTLQENGRKRYNIVLDVEIRAQGGISNGSCWFPLFGNISLVGGFPILRRAQRNAGLEISLGILASLIRSYEVIQCGQRVMMKGFDSLLLATMITSTVVLWHLHVSGESGKRIAYFDDHNETSGVVQENVSSLNILKYARHIVGWCPDAEDICGHKGTNHVISTSGLPTEPSSIVIDRLYIEGGMNIIAGLNMRINQKRNPISLMRDQDYPSLLKWIATQPIVFFDTDASDRRAWLIDGASALLHLVRISLYRDEKDEESTFDWVFDATKLNDTWANCNGRQAAIRILKNTENLNLAVYVKFKDDSKVEYSTFRDRVIKILHSLELLIDYQQNEAAKGEVRTLQTLDRRKHVIGFDILDVIEPIGAIHNRISRFDSWGEGWIDLLMGIGATTLFGQGFGPLVRPKNPAQMCDLWRDVPTQRDYMCSSVSTLKMLYEKRFRRSAGALATGELTRKITWVSPSEPFATCTCVGSPSMDHNHCDPTQFLIPSKQAWKSTLIPKNSNPVDLSCLDDRGAVVFANLGLLGRRISSNSDQQKEEVGVSLSPASDGSHSASAANTFAIMSTTTSSPIAASMTTMTKDSVVLQNAPLTEDGTDTLGNEHGRRAKRKVSRLVAVFTKGGAFFKKHFSQESSALHTISCYNNTRMYSFYYKDECRIMSPSRC